MKHVWLLESAVDYGGSTVLGVYGSRERALAAAEVEFEEQRKRYNDRNVYRHPIREKKANIDLTRWEYQDTQYYLYRSDVE